MTPEEIPAAGVNIRCVNEGLRDAGPGTHRVHVGESQGFSGYRTAYVVLESGVVASTDHFEDLDAGLREEYGQLHEPSYYDACAVAADPLAALACIAGSSGGTFIAGIDQDACIDDEPVCPG